MCLTARSLPDGTPCAVEAFKAEHHTHTHTRTDTKLPQTAQIPVKVYGSEPTGVSSARQTPLWCYVNFSIRAETCVSSAAPGAHWHGSEWLRRDDNNFTVSGCSFFCRNRRRLSLCSPRAATSAHTGLTSLLTCLCPAPGETSKNTAAPAGGSGARVSLRWTHRNRRPACQPVSQHIWEGRWLTPINRQKVYGRVVRVRSPSDVRVFFGARILRRKRGSKGEGDKVRLRVWMRGNEEGGKEGEGGKRGKWKGWN